MSTDWTSCTQCTVLLIYFTIPDCYIYCILFLTGTNAKPEAEFFSLFYFIFSLFLQHISFFCIFIFFKFFSFLSFFAITRRNIVSNKKNSFIWYKSSPPTQGTKNKQKSLTDSLHPTQSTQRFPYRH